MKRRSASTLVFGALATFAIVFLTCQRARPQERGADVLTVRVDTHDRRPISRYVYGVNGLELPRANPGLFSIFRLGGDRTSTYDWEINASNAGAGFHDSNDAYLGESTTPAGAILEVVNLAATQHAAALVTVPMMGRVAADRTGDVHADDLEARTHEVRARCAGETMSPTDDHVCTDQLVRYVTEHAPEGTPIFWSLDNEPELWPTTHPLLFGGGHVTYAMLLSRSRDHLEAIRSVAPHARVLGPASFGYPAYRDLLGAPDANGRDFLRTYVASVPGVMLDVHWYPDVRVDGVAVSSGASDAEIARIRVQLPRSLYDPGYREPSWIVNDDLHEPIHLLSRLPRPLAITEYDYGGGQDVSGTIAQADALGAFGREGVEIATFWPLFDQRHSYDISAFDLYREFFATSIGARSSDLEHLSAWGSIDEGSGRVALVLVHRAENGERVSLEGVHGTFARSVVDGTRPAVRPEPDFTCEAPCMIELGGRSVTALVQRP